MDTLQFEAALTKRGCVAVGREHCGIYNGFPIKLTFINGKEHGTTNFALMVRFATKAKKKYLREVIKANKDNAKISIINTSPNALYVNVLVKSRCDTEQVLDELLESAISKAAEHGLVAPTVCPICGSVSCDALALYRAEYVPVHDKLSKNPCPRKSCTKILVPSQDQRLFSHFSCAEKWTKGTGGCDYEPQ